MVRLVLWVIFYHVGFEFWFLPNYRASFDPRKFMWPLVSLEIRPDAVDYKSIMFRMTSFTLIAYMIKEFVADEKNVEDLKDFAQNGFNDLLDYGSEWIVKDNELDIGNKTQAEKEATFQEKIKRQMKEDIKVDEEDD